MSAPKPAPRLPHDPEIEDLVLGVLLAEGAPAYERVQSVLVADSFYQSRNRVVFQAIAFLHRQGGYIDPATVASVLDRKELRLQNAGGVERLKELASIEVPSHALHGYSAELARFSYARRLIGAAEAISVLACDMEKGEKEKTDEAIESLFKVTSNRLVHGDMESIGSVGRTELQRIEEARAAGKSIIGHETGIHVWDRAIGGLRPKMMHLIAGRPSMGKSGLLASMTRRLAMSGVPCFLFSLEMEKPAFWLRYASQIAKIDGRHLFQPGLLTDAEMERLHRGQDFIDKLPILMNDAPVLTVSAIRAMVRELLMELEPGHPAPVLAVDYLQLVTPESGGKQARQGNQAQDLTQIAYGLRGICKDFGMTGLVLAQLNREVEKREDKRPQLSDLDGSGGLEKAADTVTMIYRPWYYARAAEGTAAAEAPKEQESEEVELILRKNRYGIQNEIVKASYIAQHTDFTNIKTHDDGRPNF